VRLALPGLSERFESWLCHLRCAASLRLAEKIKNCRGLWPPGRRPGKERASPASRRLAAHRSGRARSRQRFTFL